MIELESEKAEATMGRAFVEWLDSVGTPIKADAPGRAQLSVGIVLWPEFPLLSLTGIVEALRHAGDIGDESRKLMCDWAIMSANAQPVRSSCGIEIAATCKFVDPRNFDCIFIVGGLVRSLETAPQEALRYLHGAHDADVLVVGACTGAMVLAGAGMVDGGACIHPYHVKDFQARFPGIRVVSDADYVWTGNIATVPGGTSIISFMTDLITRFCGDDRASKTVHQMALPRRSSASGVDRKQALGYNHVADGRLKRAILLMEGAIRHPSSLDTIAAEVGLSGRQLERLFMAEFDTTPKQFMGAVRLRYAKWLLLNSSKSVTEVAFETGFADCSHFVRSFKKAYGISPGKSR